MTTNSTVMSLLRETQEYVADHSCPTCHAPVRVFFTADALIDSYVIRLDHRGLYEFHMTPYEVVYENDADLLDWVFTTILHTTTRTLLNRTECGPNDLGQTITDTMRITAA